MSAAIQSTGERPLRVLVADDDPLQRSLISARLVGLNGQAVEAEDGAAAWSLLAVQTFDMAIVDLSMPGLDGLDLIKCMRSHPRTKHLPIIVVTSRNDKDSIANAFAAGASSFLVKPIVWGTFEHHVGFLLRLSQAARDARSTGQKMLATDRAKEALLFTLSDEASAAAELVLDEIRFLMGPQLQTGPSSNPVERLNRIEAACAALHAQASRASMAMEVLRENVNVDDRNDLLSNIVEHALAIVHPIAEAAGVHLSVGLPPQDATLSCDSVSIELALVHIVQNAIAHSPPGATVGLWAELTTDGVLAIEVVDEGQGMSPELVARCLAPHHVGQSHSCDEGQAGIGLLLTKAIAEAHNGTLELRSMPGQGTSALLFLPADRVVSVAAAA